MVLRLKARESKSLPGQLKLAKQNRHLPLLIASFLKTKIARARPCYDGSGVFVVCAFIGSDGEYLLQIRATAHGDCLIERID